MELRRDPVGPDREQRIDGAVVPRSTAEARVLEPQAVGELQSSAQTPRVTGVERAVPRRACPCERCESTQEHGGAVGGQRGERGEHERPELVGVLILCDPRAVEEGAELHPVRRAARQPRQLLGGLDAAIVRAQREAIVAPKRQGLDPLRTAGKIGGDHHERRRDRKVGSHVPPCGREVAAQLVDDVSAEVRGQRGHHATGVFGARPPRRGQSQCADASGFLGVPAAIEPERECVSIRHTPVEAEQGESVVAAPVLRETGDRQWRAARARQIEEPRGGVRAHAEL